MAKSLVIVESPAKAKTINKFLGRNYMVKASMGHVRDLPVKSLAVDVEKDFAAKYEVVKGREKVLAELKKAAKTSDAIYLAADPDREGEAICWHLAQELKAAKKPVHRVMFNEITKRAVTEAFAHPGSIDQRKVDAQQARRILDRLVGYKISPLLWEKVRRGISAGRVQSVALRLVVDREKEIRAFVPDRVLDRHGASWPGRTGSGPSFPPASARVDGDEGRHRLAGARRIGSWRSSAAPGSTYRIAGADARRRSGGIPSRPSPPASSSRRRRGSSASRPGRPCRWPSSSTKGSRWATAGSVGLITYMRTDSTRVSPEAQAEVAGRSSPSRYGAQFLPERPPTYKSGKGAQEAHEAIRPTSRPAGAGAGGALSHPGAVGPLHPDLEPLRGLADAPGPLRHDRGRHRGRAGSVSAPAAST